MPISADLAQCHEFSETLHTAPTAALDRYRSLCAARKTSPEHEIAYISASETIKRVLTFKHWESRSPEELALRREEKGTTIDTIADINRDVFKAFVEAQLPMLWADIIVKEGALTTEVRMCECTTCISDCMSSMPAAFSCAYSASVALGLQHSLLPGRTFVKTLFLPTSLRHTS